MKSYQYEGLDSAGNRTKGFCTAESESAAARHCREEGVYLIRLRAARDGLLPKKERPPHRKTQLLLFKRMAFLLKNGITLKEGLRIFLQENRAGTRRTLEEILRSLNGGASFSDALEERHFPQYICAMLRCGEDSGRLVEVLADVHAMLERETKALERFRQALLYPCIVFALGTVCIAFLLFFVLPAFSDVFVKLGAQAPPLLRFCLFIKEPAVRWWWAILFAGVFTLLFARHLLRKHRLSLFWLPFIGECLVMREMAKASRCTAVMLSGGMTLSQVLPHLEKLSVQPYKEVWRKAMRDIAAGKPFSHALQSRPVPEILARFAAIGESTGRLDEAMERAAVYYEDELASRLRYLAQATEPALLLAAGLFVLFVVLTVILPGFSLMDKIIG